MTMFRNTVPTVPAFLKPRSQTVPVLGVHQANLCFLQKDLRGYFHLMDNDAVLFQHSTVDLGKID